MCEDGGPGTTSRTHSEWLSERDEWKRQNTVFERVAAFREMSLNEIVKGETQSVAVGFGAADLFPMLGTHARLGRLFGPAEELAGHESVSRPVSRSPASSKSCSSRSARAIRGRRLCRPL